MDKIKKIITKVNEPLTSFNFINALGILFWLLIAISLVSIPIIYFNDKPAWLLSGQGFNNLLEIYKFPLYLLAGSLAVISLRITLVRVNQTYEQIESSYRPIIYLTHETIDFKSIIEDTLKQFTFHSHETDKSPNIKIDNVGLGVARDLHYHFEYDYNEILKILSKKEIEKQFDIYKSEDYMKLKGDNFYLDLTPPDNINTVINFLLPKSDSYEIILPIAYLQLYILYGALVYETMSNPALKEARDKHYDLIDKFSQTKIIYII
jgi:hypothetical protein